MTTSLEALQEKRDQLTESLARLNDLRPGFLTARFRKCGKPNCHCAQEDSRGHGPSYSLTHRVGGKTITQVIPPLVLPQTLYLGADGTGIPMLAEELTGVPGKTAGGAKTREVKLCTVWSADSCDDEGIPIRDDGSVSYSAAIESASAPDRAKEPSAFAQRVWRESQRRHFTQAVRRIALGDGAPWIWNLIEELFPGTTQMVDRFHAKEHLSDLGKALYSDQRASQWASERHEELDKGKPRAIVAAIRPHVANSEEARRCLHISGPIASACVIPSFTLKACVLPLGWSSQVVK